MAPPNQRSYHKKPVNKYIDHRESKLREIKQSLVQKSRLRKNYFKELKAMGEAIPEKPQRSYAPTEDKKQKYIERVKIAKQRRAEHRKEKDEERLERERITEKKRKEREQRKERLSQRTGRGQPLMGPRIEDLLEKIKKSVD